MSSSADRSHVSDPDSNPSWYQKKVLSIDGIRKYKFLNYITLLYFKGCMHLFLFVFFNFRAFNACAKSCDIRTYLRIYVRMLHMCVCVHTYVYT